MCEALWYVNVGEYCLSVNVEGEIVVFYDSVGCNVPRECFLLWAERRRVWRAWRPWLALASGRKAAVDIGLRGTLDPESKLLTAGCSDVDC